MKIEKDTVVTLRCRIADDQGRLVQDGKQPMVYLHGGYDNTFPKIEAALEGRASGDELTLVLAPADAFGERDEALLRTIPKREFPPGVKVGGQLELPGPQGAPQAFTVSKIKGDAVHLDGNHPLAGRTLKLAIKVIGVRAASAEEIAHRHVHGEHGHHH
ncbi:FKBP-type peptidyl-prolyl cis-trans isomerase [Ramlibacter tataouinensis]|uniref:peptidylprolyl isomerase n=1 Tax=Ramlibacter tataouinensis (strain ATCC BAA-407 / DSM 14655 / LMG 21543 / TTB310) TaxID=365046 RepID=F5Y303_RAMTT|nr:peptidylprolyl isomerase [Ramlibacter tataouinensis]AEG94883.1 peptidylprolyl isomerase (Cyclophilin)-like protein [Ramlibacter tataouinensis TTB310]